MNRIENDKPDLQETLVEYVQEFLEVVIWLISSGQVRSRFLTSSKTWERSVTCASSSVVSPSERNVIPACGCNQKYEKIRETEGCGAELCYRQNY